MKPAIYVPLIFAVAVFLFIVKSFFDQYVPAYDFPGWEHGARGYQVVLKEARGEGKPLIVYFHTSWCGWCEKLDKNYLATGEAEEFLKGVPRVEINPDKGKDEKLLFKKFGLSGYPSFLVFSPEPGGDPVMVSPFLQGRTLTVEEFLVEIRKGMSTG